MEAIPISADPTSARTAESKTAFVRCGVTAGRFTIGCAIDIAISGVGAAPAGDTAAAIGSIARIIIPVSSPSLRTARIAIKSP